MIKSVFLLKKYSTKNQNKIKPDGQYFFDHKFLSPETTFFNRKFRVIKRLIFSQKIKPNWQSKKHQNSLSIFIKK